MEQNTSQQLPPAAQAPPMLIWDHTYRSPQRVIVTGSMLYAYSIMRGNVDKDPLELDPLHAALFLNPTTFLNSQFEQQVNIPGSQLYNDPYMVQEFAPGSVFFHDVSGPVYPNAPHPRRSIQEDDWGKMSLTYEDYKLQNPPKYPNHYRGGEGYGNYGYTKVNGRWIDSDGIDAVHDALHNRGPYIPEPPIGITPVPNLYEDRIYRDFMDELNSEGGDGEGDPRAMYITPATFARWAAGVSKGDCHSYMKVPPQDPPQSEPRGRTRTRKGPPKIVQIQFCEETGSAFTGEYSLERHPSLCMSSRGVDMMMQPHNFASSYPQLALDFDRRAYGGLGSSNRSSDNFTESLTSSNVSMVIPFTKDNAIRLLADPDDTDPNTGLMKWNEYKDLFDGLQEELRDDYLLTVDKENRRTKIAMEALQLFKEAYFMEKRLDRIDTATGTPITRRSIARNMSRPTLTSPPKPKFLEAGEQNPTRRFRRQNAPETFGGSSDQLGPCPPLVSTLSRESSLPNIVTPPLQPKNTRSFYEVGHNLPCLSSTISHSSHRNSVTSGAHIMDPREAPIPDGRTKPSSPPRASDSQPRNSLRYKKQFERYFKERELRERIKVNKMKISNANLDFSINETEETIKELKVYHEKYRNIMDIKSVSQIPDLIPKRKKSLADHRAKMNKGLQAGPPNLPAGIL